MRKLLLGTFIILFGFTLSGFTATEDKPIRIFISADMEGIAGAIEPNQIIDGGMEYQKFREIMTNEVLAAIEGARAGGATEFVVADAHGGMQNLLFDRFPDDVEIVRGSPRPHGMMEGIQDGHFDGAIYVGYHASSANIKGVRAHSFSSANFSEVTLNGLAVSEGYFNAALAGNYGVPVIMVTGDQAATDEVADTVGDMEKAVVKKSISFHSARTLTPNAANKIIRAKAKTAVERMRIGDFKPFIIKGPISMQITTHYYQPAELLAYLKSVSRIGGRTIEYIGDDMLDLSTFKEFLAHYSLGLKP
ncbi:MAG: M55 family metallopeptidase [Sphingomonadales bacterium]